MKNAIGTVFIFLGAGLLFYLLRKYSYLMDFLFINSITDVLFIIFALTAAVWAAVRLDKLVSGSKFQLLIQSAAILVMCLFIGYQLFASHFYSEQYLKEAGLEKVERLFELGEMDLSPEDLRVQVEEIAVKESAYVLSLYGVKPRPEGAEEFEVLDFKRRYYAYEMTVRSVNDGKSAWYSFSRDGLDFKISGNSVME